MACSASHRKRLVSTTTNQNSTDVNSQKESQYTRDARFKKDYVKGRKHNKVEPKPTSRLTQPTVSSLTKRVSFVKKDRNHERSSELQKPKTTPTPATRSLKRPKTKNNRVDVDSSSEDNAALRLTNGVILDTVFSGVSLLERSESMDKEAITAHYPPNQERTIDADEDDVTSASETKEIHRKNEQDVKFKWNEPLPSKLHAMTSKGDGSASLTTTTPADTLPNSTETPDATEQLSQVACLYTKTDASHCGDSEKQNRVVLASYTASLSFESKAEERHVILEKTLDLDSEPEKASSDSKSNRNRVFSRLALAGLTAGLVFIANVFLSKK